MRNTIVSLTGSAARYAEKHQIRDELMTLNIGQEGLSGDVVTLETHGRPHDFVILRRRWVIGSAGRQLEITLDHPPRTVRP